MTNVTNSAWELLPQGVATARLRESGDAQAQVREAVKSFESVLARQWLKEIRAGSFAAEKGEGAAYLELADDQLAMLFARNGGFGMAQQMAAPMLAQIEAARQMKTSPDAAPVTTLNKSADIAVPLK